MQYNITEEVKSLLQAIESNIIYSEENDFPCIPLQYISEELESLIKSIKKDWL